MEQVPAPLSYLSTADALKPNKKLFPGPSTPTRELETEICKLSTTKKESLLRAVLFKLSELVCDDRRQKVWLCAEEFTYDFRERNLAPSP